MKPETSEPIDPFAYSPDLFAEPHDHANLWDISAFWPEEPHRTDETVEEPVDE